MGAWTKFMQVLTMLTSGCKALVPSTGTGTVINRWTRILSRYLWIRCTDSHKRFKQGRTNYYYRFTVLQGTPPQNRCCGSGSVCFWATSTVLRIRIRMFFSHKYRYGSGSGSFHPSKKGRGGGNGKNLYLGKKMRNKREQVSGKGRGGKHFYCFVTSLISEDWCTGVPDP